MYFAVEIIFGSNIQVNSNLSFVCLIIQAITVSATFKACRTVSIALTIAVIVLTKFQKFGQILGKLNLTSNLFYSKSVIKIKLYLYLTYCGIRQITCQSISIGFSAGFLGLVVSSWVSITDYNYLPFYIHLMFILTALVIRCGVLLLAWTITDISDSSIMLVKKCRHQFAFPYSTSKNPRVRIDMLELQKVAKSLIMERIFYIPFCEIDRHFPMLYCAKAVDRLVDVLLIA